MLLDIAGSFSSPEAFMQNVSGVLTDFVNTMIGFIPNFIAALLIFIVGYIVAVVLAGVFRHILAASKFEKFLERHKMDDALGNIKVSPIFVKIVKYYLILVFLQAAVSELRLGTLTEFLNVVLLYAPAFIGAALIYVISAMVGELIKEKIKEVDVKSKWINFVARATKFVIIFFGIVMALSAIGFDTAILEGAFITLLQAFAYGAALAIGISFGLGGQEDAKALIADVKKKISK